MFLVIVEKQIEIRLQKHFDVLGFTFVLRLCLILAQEASESVFQFLL